MSNQIRTTVLLAIMTAVIMWVGKMLGGTGGMMIALIFAGAMNFFSYWFSDKIVLKMYKAQEATEEEASLAYRMVEVLSKEAGLPMPKVYIIPQDAPNAFATGRNPENAVVAVTQGLLKTMNPDELAGVLAHELGHIKNRDILIGTIAATMAGAIMMIANLAKWSAIFGGFRSDDDDGGGFVGLIAMAIIAPIAAMLIQMAISRSREYLADATAAKITGNSEGLASALEKLDAYSRQIPMQAEPATAHMFITNPLAGRNMMKFFSTHPPIEERVARLRDTKIVRSDNDSTPKPGNMSDQARNFWNNLS
ncbi:MAG: zinc metalloprotease HtpX [Desulfobacteraceae bacterium]|nr:zinc metalloprotease HtpX [Desulfobacteraceae bacterium]MBC2756435.1 zinc metalloprotease HtpX [Desulfobacteraceae bacterium]MBC2763565.1 zinc metalloprotease HtpX [ANME-2 cluster archaeon]